MLCRLVRSPRSVVTNAIGAQANRNVRTRVSCPDLGVRRQASGVRRQASGVWCQVSGVRCRVTKGRGSWIGCGVGC
jgi:hypothetical protein